MAESHVVTGLVGKRAEITGQIEACQAELSRLQSAIAHLDYINMNDGVVKVGNTNNRVGNALLAMGQFL
ncbi:hypothetical protein MCAMS1_01046 [biofilm metagenome]